MSVTIFATASLMPALAVLALSAPASGQASEVVLELGASQVRPPVLEKRMYVYRLCGA